MLRILNTIDSFINLKGYCGISLKSTIPMVIISKLFDIALTIVARNSSNVLSRLVHTALLCLSTLRDLSYRGGDDIYRAV